MAILIVRDVVPSELSVPVRRKRSFVAEIVGGMAGKVENRTVAKTGVFTSVFFILFLARKGSFCVISREKSASVI